MAAPRKQPIDSAGNRLYAKCFGALSNGLRLSIVSTLRDGRKNVSQLAALLHVDQSAVSHGLRTLVSAGFVRQQRVGSWRYYSLNCGSSDGLLKIIDLHTAIVGGRSPRSSGSSQYCKMLDTLPIAALIHVQERVAFANRFAHQLYSAKGIKKLHGLSIAQLLDKKTYRRAKPRMEAMLAGKKFPVILRENIFLADGTKVEADVAATPILFRGQPAVQVLVYPHLEQEDK